MTTKLLTVAVLLALGTGLVGGLLGVALFSGSEEVATLQDQLQGLSDRVGALDKRLETVTTQASELASQVSGLQARLAELEGAMEALRSEIASLRAAPGPGAVQTQSAGPKVAYVDLSGLLNEIFEPVSQAVAIKNQDLQDLRDRHEAGEIDDVTYQKEALKLEVELLAVPLHWDLSLIRKMASSPEFSDLKENLEELMDKVQPLEKELDALRQTAEQGDFQNFLAKYQQLNSVFQQLDQLLSQVVTAMLTEVTRDIAQAQGYALVLRKQDALYLDESQLDDLSPQVKERLSELF
jgi:Skp family chaperone for outer membrane proteins